MVNMARSKEELKEKSISCCPEESDKPSYPYGLCIRLDEETIKKLGLDKLPSVGDKMSLNAKVEVTSVSSYSSTSGKSSNLELQITDMELGKAKAEKSDEDVMYGKSKG